MQLDKEQVLDFLRKEGKNEYVQKAIQELPQKIDHEQHAQMLQQKFGIDPGKLAEKAIEEQLGVTSPSHKPAPARPASTASTANEPGDVLPSNEPANAPARPTSTASPSNEPVTASPSNEPADPSLSNEPADAPARPASTGSVEDDRPPA
jgi:hypothetical protein